MPSHETIRRWQVDKEGFYEMYAHAREMRADRIVDEIIDIADNEPDPHRARVMVDTRKWVASKFYPKMYADRPERENTANVTVVLGDLSGTGKVIEGETIEPRKIGKAD